MAYPLLLYIYIKEYIKKAIKSITKIKYRDIKNKLEKKKLICYNKNKEIT